jgi:hypothetical protein
MFGPTDHTLSLESQVTLQFQGLQSWSRMKDAEIDNSPTLFLF